MELVLRTAAWDEPWLGTLLGAGIAIAAVALLALLVRLFVRAVRNRAPAVGELARRIRFSGLVTALLVALWVTARVTAPGNLAWWPVLSHWFLIAVVISGAWLASALISFGFERAMQREEGVEGVVGRRRRTQLTIIHRLVLVIVAVLAVGVVLFSFPEMRVVGTSLLASAGIVSIVAGLAAQSILGNLIAGIQLAFTDAIRVGDVVVVEGAWGRIGEINLSYVVVHVWDERRLVIPCSYFTSNPIETWTRASDRVLGLVYMDLDWRVPIEDLRAKFFEIIEAMPEWDRRKANVWVTDAQGGHVTVRFMMSAKDSDDQWTLRCVVREKIMTWLQAEHPAALPTRRFLAGPADGAPASGPN